MREMMNSILAICLTLVFVGWVWYLKLQLSELIRQTGSPVEGLSRPSATPHLVHSALPDERHVRTNARRTPTHRSTRAVATSCSREGGIPTWTITA